MGIITNSPGRTAGYARMRARAAGGALGRNARPCMCTHRHACAAARITRAVPAHDPPPPRRHTHRARPAAGARARRRARHARERARTSCGPTALGHEAHAR